MLESSREIYIYSISLPILQRICRAGHYRKDTREKRQMTDLEFTKIYLEGEPLTINWFLEVAKKLLGDGINIIDLHPKLEEEK